MRPGPDGADLSRKAIFAEIDHSLRRLGTDYVDRKPVICLRFRGL
jgi:1-deoxyxylulose-5-phosphate synthase